MQHKFLNLRPTLVTRAIVIVITLFALVSLTVSTVFAYDTGFSSPTAGSTPGKSWKNISYAFASDNLYATAKRSNKQLRLNNFNIPGIPGGSTINGIEVTVEGLTLGLQANVALSYNGGTSYTSALLTSLSGTETGNTLGSPVNTWGRTWSPADFTNTNFVAKLTTTGANGNGITLSVDQVQVKVYYTAPSATISLAPVSGSYAGTASMTATLVVTNGSAPISGKNINFYVGGTGLNSSGNCTGTSVGTATTQSDGTATLANASLSGISSGSYPYGACASFSGDGSYQATSITSSLTVIGTATTLVADPATGTYGNTVDLSATLTLTNGGTAINNQWINFYLFGNFLGASKTNNSGVATLSNVSLIGYDTGSSNDIGVGFAGDANLDPSNANALITINARPITVTAVQNTKVYDGTTTSNGVPNITSGSLVTGDVAEFTQTFNTQDSGTGKTLTPGGVVNDDNYGLNYIYTFNSVTSGVINAAPLSVIADDKNKLTGESDPVFTFQYSGLVNGETSAVIETSPTCTVSVPHSAAGTYPIVCSSAADVENNYSFSYTSGTLTVGTMNVYVPMLFKDAFGGNYDAALYIQNMGSSAANITMKYYDSNGSLTCTQNDAIPALASRGYWLPSLNCLGSAWVGGVVITSDQRITAVGRPHIGAEVMTYNGFDTGSTSMYVPMLFKDAFGGDYDAALYVQNVSGNSASVTMKYYDSNGSLTCTQNDTIPALASRGYWLPSLNCLGSSWVGGVVVTSNRAVVAVGRPHIGTQITTYDGFATGNTTTAAPMLFKDAFGGNYDAALYVQNVSGNSASVTMKYYDSNGSLTCTQNDTIPALASRGYWLPSLNCLGSSWVGGVIVTSDQSVVAVGRPHIGAEVTTYDGFAAGSIKASASMLFKAAFGGTYNAALYVQNVSGNSANVTMKYYDSNGNLTCTQNDIIPALASRGYWLPSISCINSSWVGGVVVTSDQAIVTVGRPHINDQVATYQGISVP